MCFELAMSDLDGFTVSIPYTKFYDYVALIDEITNEKKHS